MAKISSVPYYLDTNVISECFRVGCWGALAANLHLVTVHKVHEECATGGGHGIDIDQVIAGTEARAATLPEIIALCTKLAARVSLDAGEEHLLAVASIDRAAWKICSPDNASVRGCHYLGLLDRHISLEELLAMVGHRSKTPLQRQYTKSWLEGKRTALWLEGF